MQEIIHELFTEEELNIFDEERLSLSLKKVISDLDNKKINFYYLGNDQLYREILPRYFKWQGYGYLGNSSLHILKDYMTKDRDLADTSLALLLLDTGIIKEIPVTEKNPLEIENTIKYKRSKGLKEKIIISYDVLDRFPFYIKEVQCGHKNIINVEVNNEGSRKSVTLNIDISVNDHVTYNFTESLIIYTDFGIKTMDFSVVCDTTSAVNSKVVEDFDSFLKLVKINRKSAKNIFSNEDSFRAFLEQNGNIEQILNYEDCKKISDEFNTYPFSIFCDINELKKESLFKEAFSRRGKLSVEKINNNNIIEKKEEKVLLDKSLEQSKINYNNEKLQDGVEKVENKDINDKVIDKKDIISSKPDKEIVNSKKEEEKPKKEEINNKGNEIRKTDNKTISLEYIGKITNYEEESIKYNKELITKHKYKTEEKSNVVDYGEIKNKREEKEPNQNKESKTSVTLKSNEKVSKVKEKDIENNIVQNKIKRIENKEQNELVVKELQRDTKYKITKKEKDNKEAHKKDMSIIELIKEMLKGFKKD